MQRILNLLRIRVWSHLDTVDARRHPGGRAGENKPGKVVVPNVPEAAFWALLTKLNVLSRQAGAKGDLQWRHRFEQQTRQSTKERTCLPLATYKPVTFLASLETVCDTNPSAQASSGHGFLRILPSGDISFIDLPLHFEGVKTIINQVDCFDIHLTFGIGIVPNARGPPVRSGL